MSDDMVAWLAAELARREQAALAAGGDEWTLQEHESDTVAIYDSRREPVVYDEGWPSEAQKLFIADNDPASVLRRVAADRKTLDEHADDGYGDCVRCAGEDEEAESSTGAILYLRTQVPHPCATVRNLAEGYGWTGKETP